MKFYSLIFFIVFTSFALQSQDSRLASQSYNSGEYEKAASVYLQLYEKQPNSHYYFEQYVQSLLAMEDYKTAEQAIIKQLKKNPDHVQLYVTHGNLLEREFKPEEAEKKYRKAIEELPANGGIISNLANSFMRLTKYDLAIETYAKAEKLLNNERIYVNNLADLYRRKGDTSKMIEYYIKAASNYPDNVDRYKTNFQRYLNEEEQLEETKAQLYDNIQKDPDNTVYPELLEWVFIELEDYNSALRQARALDRKLEEDGIRVVNLSNIALNAKAYDIAIKGFNYIIDSKGKTSIYYVSSKSAILKAKRKKIINSASYKEADLDSLAYEYESFIDELGTNSKTEFLVKEYADFLAQYKNDLDKAITVLEELISLSSINKYVRAQAKVALADYYLMKGEIWEATLLYSQVEKEFKEEHMGEVSRFRNAMLAYYAGEFGWAQEQFDILESATSKLISNDAIDMSVFIMDNMGLDTTDIPLKMFADAELLAVQNRLDEAYEKYNSINKLYPEHALLDDILYQQALIHYKKKEYQASVDLYTKVYEEFPEEIRADNALFKLAEIYENEMEDLEKAQELYEKLFIDFSNSTYAIEARKRYRLLRGDDI